MSCVGEVKSFNDTKGWGFITYEGTDVFLHVKDCTDGGRPVVGDQVTFDLEEDQRRQGQQKALNVTGCTGVKDEGAKGGWGASGGAKGAGKGKGGGSHQGSVKSFNDTKGWGFIDCDGTDIFVHVRDCGQGRPVVGDYLSFDVEEDQVRQGQKKAINVTGCTGTGDGKGKGGGKGQDKGGYGAQMWFPAWGFNPFGGPYGCGGWDGGKGKGGWGGPWGGKDGGWGGKGKAGW